MIKEIAAGIIIYRKTFEGLKFLILYHGGSYWNFPKGKIESEEKSFPAALRETREETGLNRNDLKFYNNFKAYEKFVFWGGRGIKKQKVFKTVIFYLAETEQFSIKISKEHNGYGWLTYKEAMKILSKYKDSQKVLTQAYEVLQIKELLK
ncbi:MAG: NUDIX domain-containing protein [Patescibacteria group bacterium]